MDTGAFPGAAFPRLYLGDGRLTDGIWTVLSENRPACAAVQRNAVPIYSAARVDAYPTEGSVEKSIDAGGCSAALVQSGMLADAGAFQSGYRTGLRCGRAPGTGEGRACRICSCSSGLLLPDELVCHIENRIFKRNASGKDWCNYESEKNIYES